MRNIVKLALASLLVLLPMQTFSQDYQLNKTMVGANAGFISVDETVTDGAATIKGSVGQIAVSSMDGFPMNETSRQNWYIGFWGPWWTQDLVSVEDENTNNTSKVSNFPNPFNNETSIKFELTRATTVTLNIYDISGKMMFTLNTQATVGENVIVWNARSSDGQMVPTGTYMYEVIVEAGDSFQSETQVMRNIMVVSR